MNMILPQSANQEEVITRQLLGNKAQIQGRVQKLSDGSFEAYRGIPYAKAPIGELRFKSPVPYEIQDDTLIDGSKFGEACPQLLKSEVIGSEDCLFLNVFVPGANKGNLPVMVYFPGGTFVMGDGGLYGPEYFMSQGNVILVTVNYRLGSLGFLSLEDDTIAGNMGLKDQMEALRWVQAHIQSFGGDKDSVTILAIQRVEYQFSVFSWRKNPFMHSTHAPSYYSSILANDLGCDTETTIKTLDCLREISMAELVQKQHIPWKPVEDFGYASKPLFKRSFAEALGHGTFRHVPILIGGTSEEGALFTPKLFANDGEKFVEISENFDILGSTLLMCIDEADVTEEDSATANIINIEYFNKENITYSSENIDKLIKMLTDVHFLGPLDN
ncbi:Carboxylic ester hydrolase, partial [Caligus rogercresseyi]